MEWYYTDNGTQAGPVDDAGLQTLVVSGKINAETLVWREGMQSWMAYGSLTAPGAADAHALAMRCSECGNAFPADELIQIGAGSVCANCKPIAVQKLKEGVTLSGEHRYGGFWVRFRAKFIDGIILGVAIALVNWGTSAMFTHDVSDSRATMLLALGNMGIGFCIRGLYNTLFVGAYSATPGKMALGLKIIRPGGEHLTYARAAGRFMGELVSSLTMCIGYIMAGFDEEKRALHDRICDTRVVYK